MENKSCRKCRREGIKLFLKGDKCNTSKCPFTRRSYQPGDKGQQRRTPRTSNYAAQLREKQKARRTYNLGDKQFKNLFFKATQSTDSTSKKLIELLETRIDNAVYRAGLAPSRRAARQIVNHAKIKLNGKKVSIPSIQIKKGDKIEILPAKNFKFSGLKPSDWLKLDKKKLSFEIIGKPQISPDEIGLNVQLIIEYYSR